MTQLQRPSGTSNGLRIGGRDDSRVIRWIEAMLLFVGGAATAWLIGGAAVTLDQVWPVVAIAAAALTLGFGAAFLFEHMRQGARALALEADIADASARIDALSADHQTFERRVRGRIQAGS